MVTIMWAVTLSFRVNLDEKSLSALAHQLQKEANASLADLPGHIEVTACEPGPDELRAASSVKKRVADLVPGDVCAVKIALQDEDAPNGEFTLPQVVSSPDAAAILGISRQRLHQIRGNPDFPPPLFQLPTGPIWGRDAIERYGATRQGRRHDPAAEPRA